MPAQPTQSHERASLHTKSQKLRSEEKAKMMAKITETLGKIGIIFKLPGQPVAITPEDALKHFLVTGCDHMLEELMEAMAKTDQAICLVGMTHNLERFFGSVRQDTSSQRESKDRAEFMKQAKKDLLRFGISIRVPMDGAMTYSTPIEAIEHLEAKGCDHKMADFTAAIDETLRGLALAYGTEISEKIFAVLEKGRTGCDRLN